MAGTGLEVSDTTALTIVETNRDRYARTAELKVAGKTIQTPSFCTLIHKRHELDLFMSLKSSCQASHLSALILRIFDVNKIMPKPMRYAQTDMFGKIVKDKLSLFMENHLLFIDPALEYLYYESLMGEFATNPRTPKVIADYVTECITRKYKESHTKYQKWKNSSHNRFWDEISKNASKRTALIRDFLSYEIFYGADILIPPTPLIASREMLRSAIAINDQSKEISRGLYKKECANYFLLRDNVLKDENLIDEIKKYLMTDSTHLTIFKFKYLDLLKTGSMVERENYRILLDDLSYLSEHDKNRAFMVLENGYQCFLSACVGFDIVSTSITGYDREVSFSEAPPYGAWYDPRLMINRSFEDVKRIFVNNGNRLPCPCSACRSITDIEVLEATEWKEKRRFHYAWNMNTSMEQIARAIKERNIELARDKLARSELTVLKDIIPRIRT